MNYPRTLENIMQSLKPQTIGFAVVIHMGARLFLHQKSGRANFKLSYFDIPLNTTLTLIRNGKPIAKADAVSIGTHAAFEWFLGTAPLIQGYTYDKKSNYSSEILASQKGILADDELVLELLAYEPYDFTSLLDRALLFDRRIARKEFNRHERVRKKHILCKKKLKRYFPDKRSLIDFMILNRRRSVHAMVQIARRKAHERRRQKVTPSP